MRRNESCSIKNEIGTEVGRVDCLRLELDSVVKIEIKKDCHGQDHYALREIQISLPSLHYTYLELSLSMIFSLSLLYFLHLLHFNPHSPKSTRRAAIWLWCCKVSWLSRPVSCTLILNDLQDEFKAGRLSPVGVVLKIIVNKSNVQRHHEALLCVSKWKLMTSCSYYMMKNKYENEVRQNSIENWKDIKKQDY